MIRAEAITCARPTRVRGRTVQNTRCQPRASAWQYLPSRLREQVAGWHSRPLAGYGSAVGRMCCWPRSACCSWLRATLCHPTTKERLPVALRLPFPAELVRVPSAAKPHRHSSYVGTLSLLLPSEALAALYQVCDFCQEGTHCKTCYQLRDLAELVSLLPCSVQGIIAKEPVFTNFKDTYILRAINAPAGLFPWLTAAFRLTVVPDALFSLPVPIRFRVGATQKRTGTSKAV